MYQINKAQQYRAQKRQEIIRGVCKDSSIIRGTEIWYVASQIGGQRLITYLRICMHARM